VELRASQALFQGIIVSLSRVELRLELIPMHSSLMEVATDFTVLALQLLNIYRDREVKRKWLLLTREIHVLSEALQGQGKDQA
jgi:hypothetical protein